MFTTYVSLVHLLVGACIGRGMDEFMMVTKSTISIICFHGGGSLFLVLKWNRLDWIGWMVSFIVET